MANLDNLYSLARQYQVTNPRFAEQALSTIYTKSELQSLLAGADSEEEKEKLSKQSLSSILAGAPTGTSKLANGRLIISDLCPFKNVPGGDVLDSKEINAIQYPPLDIKDNNGNRSAYIQKCLNTYVADPKTFASLMTDIPSNRYEVELPLDINENPWYNKIRIDMLYYLESIYKELNKRRLNVSKLYITSAYRSPLYNAKYGNIDYDSHIIGCAVDISASAEIISHITEIANSMNVGGIGRGNNIIHLDINYRARWEYNERI